MENENQLIQIRREKLAKIISLGLPAFPNQAKRTEMIGDLWQNEKKYLAEKKKVIITGRLQALRRQGRSGFANLTDETGRIQLYVRQDEVGEANYELFKLLDLGDFLQVEGECFLTQSGEYSVKAGKLTILGKSLRPLPTVKEKMVEGERKRYDEFADIELRYRKRYLDLLLNPQVKDTFRIRAEAIRLIRRFLEEKGFLEVDTPILQPLYGGANARPFTTHHNTLNMDLYLRIAIELYLKRLIVGGFEKIFEIGKCFRNEGMDRNHNPEFTMLELYQAYADYHDIMDLTEQLIVYVVRGIHGSSRITFRERELDLGKPWQRLSMLELVKEKTGQDMSDFDLEKIRQFYREHELELDMSAGPGKLIAGLFEIYVEPELLEPTFVLDFPKEISPLAKGKPGNPHLVERFELFIQGDEYANAFTELNDPNEQRLRMEAQTRLRELGDQEANVLDEDFLEALEFGLPPTGGLGIGIDRLVMMLTDNTSIKEVILFPQMKPEN